MNAVPRSTVIQKQKQFILTNVYRLVYGQSAYFPMTKQCKTMTIIISWASSLS